jgi:phosphate transport system protein
MLEAKMNELKQRLIEYASLIETMIEKSITGLLERRKDLLVEVMEQDEVRANNLEIEIDELCTILIAQFQPRAVDLRTVLMILKINNDLERVGDHAVNICESSLFLIEQPVVKPFVDLPRMATESVGMLRDSINAFVRGDSQQAKRVCERDSAVDKLGDQILVELTGFMASDAATIERSLHLLRISRNLERIADLSTNICEDVIFIVDGRIIKHHKEDEEEAD